MVREGFRRGTEVLSLLTARMPMPRARASGFLYISMIRVGLGADIDGLAIV